MDYGKMNELERKAAEAITAAKVGNIFSPEVSRRLIELIIAGHHFRPDASRDLIQVIIAQTWPHEARRDPRVPRWLDEPFSGPGSETWRQTIKRAAADKEGSYTRRRLMERMSVEKIEELASGFDPVGTASGS